MSRSLPKESESLSVNAQEKVRKTVTPVWWLYCTEPTAAIFDSSIGVSALLVCEAGLLTSACF